MLNSTLKYLWSPANFRAESILSGEMVKYKDFAHYFVHLIFHKLLSDARCDMDSVVCLKRDYLVNIFPGKKVFNEVRKALLTNGVLICDNQYIEKEKSFGYRIHPDYFYTDYDQIEYTNTVLKRKFTKESKMNIVQVDYKDKVQKRILKNLYRVEIDMDSVQKEVDSLPDTEITKKFFLKGQATWIDDAYIFFNSDEYGRIHHNLSNLKREIRKHLTVDGEKLANVDIRNCQPMLFMLLLFENPKLLPKKHRSPSMPTRKYFCHENSLDVDETWPIDVYTYWDLTQKGQFYEFLMDLLDISQDENSRVTFKKEFFRQVFFGHKQPILPYAEVFRDLFPNIFYAINVVKAGNYKQLAHKMQRAESDLMIRTVCPLIMQELPDAWFSTVHDSILTTPGFAESVSSIINEEFQKKGLSPTIKIEYY